MNSIETLIKYKNGELSKGIGLGSKILDEYLVYKPNRFCCMVGRANIGKTFFQFWYFLALSKKHGLKWGIYSIENEIWILKMYLVEFLAGCKIQDIEEKELYGYDNWIDEHFTFIEQKSYTLKEILEVGKSLNVDGLFIDPYNALDKPSGNSHEYDYEAIRMIQKYKLEYGSVYINHHPVTPSQRRVIIDKNSDYFGYPDFMHYFDVEGGGKWFNACDSWISLHRFTAHPTNWMFTNIIIEKEKVTQTGGKVTPQNQHILAEYKNNRFYVSGQDLLEEGNDLDFDNAEDLFF